MRIKYYFVFLVILLFINGCIEIPETHIEQEKIEEEKGTGILVIESAPDNAELFIDDKLEGKTPLKLYNIEVGLHNILIIKQGYEDYRIAVKVEAGKKTEFRALLELKKEIIEEVIEEPEVEKEKEEEIKETLTKEIEEGQINVVGLLQYYDFSEKSFTTQLKTGVDVFSRRYKTHFTFTRYSPVEVSVIDKNIKDVEKEDCNNIRGSLVFLHSGQTACIKTKEGGIVAIGGEWTEAVDAVLTWKMFD